MGLISRLYNFAAGKRIASTQMNEELNQLVAGHNDHDTRIVTAEGKIVTLEDQVQAIADENIPPESITYSMLSPDVLNAFLKRSGDSMNGPLTIDNSIVMGTAESGTDQWSRAITFKYRDSAGMEKSDIYLVVDNTGALRLTRQGVADYYVYHSGYQPFTTGTYTGDGAASRTIALPFTPSLVLVMMAQTSTRSASETAIAYTGVPGSYTIGPQTTLSITTNGFVVYQGTEAATNKAGNAYNYVAFR